VTIYVPVYLVVYNVPSEDGLFYVERTLDNGNKVRLYVGVNEIRNKMKMLRFRFYEILNKYSVIKTRIGKLVSAENAPLLRKELLEWSREYAAIQKDIDLFIKNPLAFKGGDFVIDQVRKYGLPWPPKDFNIQDRFFVEIIGPVNLPKKLYDQLIQEAITGKNGGRKQ